MIHIWNAIKSIFVNDAHNIISKRGKEILAEQQKEYTFVPNTETTRTQSDMVDIVIGVNGKRRRVETDYSKIFNNQREMKREMKQTAVEWLEFEITRRGPKENNPPQWLKELYEQAKEMEKEQTLKFGIKCQLDFIKSDGIRSVEDLYESTFNTNEK